MKVKAIKIASAAVLVTAGVTVGMVMAKPFEANSAATPGTVNDPVVTKSYVDEQIAKLAANGSGSGNSGNTGSGNTGGSSESVKLEVVEIPVGKTLMAGAGAEVVVRVGKAVAFSTTTDGLSDLTDGIDIKSGKDVPKNHLIWFPRDGRGIQGHPDETAPLTVLVKGSYTLR
ncbi:hypothetical protein ACX93W_23760 [Paenibacillus sp. CAU 1782]